MVAPRQEGTGPKSLAVVLLEAGYEPGDAWLRYVEQPRKCSLRQVSSYYNKSRIVFASNYFKSMDNRA